MKSGSHPATRAREEAITNVPRLLQQSSCKQMKQQECIISAPVREADRLTAYLHLSLHIPNSNPPVSLPYLQQKPLLPSASIHRNQRDLHSKSLPLLIRIALTELTKPMGFLWEPAGYFSQLKRQANCRSSPLPLFPQIQSPSLITSSVANHLLWCPLLLYSLMQWITQIFFKHPLLHILCSKRHSLRKCRLL